jgi:hypothetical protein
MDTLLSEQYIIMEVTPDGDYELCFDEFGKQEVYSRQEEAVKTIKEIRKYYDYPLIIVRETQTIVG